MTLPPATSGPPAHSEGVIGPATTGGLAMAVALWCAWFITHLPWLGLTEQVSIPILLGVWVLAAVFAHRIAGVARWGLARGGAAGAVSALLGLLILGSKLAEPAGAGGLKPGAAAIALGFLALGTIIGLIGAAAARVLPASASRPGWLPRLAIVAVVAVAPLLFVGGLVTSTNSGMAVPDWPNTYGSNMFLYPLGPRVAGAAEGNYEKIYLEHSHRLFGTLVGLATLALMVGALRNDDRLWVRRWAVAVFLLVCVQGALGGARVLFGDTEIARDNRLYAMVHGVLAQVVFAALVALAVFLTPAYRALRDGARCICGYSLAGLGAAGGDVTCPECGRTAPLREPSPADDEATWPQRRRLRAVATGAAHATLMQLVFGALYRHFRSDHALWTHAAFSILVVLLCLAAGFGAQALRNRSGPGHAAAVAARVGAGLIGVVGLQFILGWIAFAAGGRGHEAGSITQALIRTVHQANGALLLALATVLYMWSRALAPRRRAEAAGR